MVKNNISTDDPNTDKNADNIDNTGKDDKPADKVEQKPAFDFFDEEEINNLRMALADSDNTEIEMDDSNNFEQFLNRLSAENNATAPDTSTTESSQTDQTGENNSDNTNTSPTDFTNIRAFEPFDINSPFSRPFETPKESEETISTSNYGLNWKKEPENASSSEGLTERINALKNQNLQESSEPNVVIPPFVVEGSFHAEEQSNSITDKIRNGLLPAETLELLITKTMDEEDVVKIIEELGFDWNLTPGDSREEKIQFLVSYLSHKEPFQNWDTFDEIKKPAYIPSSDVEPWEESDSRLVELQSSLDIPQAPPEKPKFFLFNINQENYQTSNPLFKWGIIGLSMLAILLIGFIAYYLIKNNLSRQTTTAQSATQYPYPQMIQLPGGWAFDLKTGAVEEGEWNPQGAEWLEGTEVCKLISLPWSKQLEAVYQTIQPGESLNLVMSNKDINSYTIESTQKMMPQEVSKIVNRDSPCLLVIISNPENEERLSIISSPDLKLGPPAKATTP